MVFNSLVRFCLSAILLMAYSCSEKREKPLSGPLEVSAFTVEPQDIPAELEYTAVAESSHLVEIRARVEGYLFEIAYVEGTFVREGELLFQLDPKPFLAKLDIAKGGLAEQEARLWDAKRSLARYKPLYEQKAASLRDLDNATANELAAEAAVQSAKATVFDAELNLGYTTIVSPINGLAGKSRFREGALITPGPQSLLTTVSIIDPIWVNFSVSESDLLGSERDVLLGRLRFPKDNNFEIELTLSDGIKFPFKGKLDFWNPSYDQKTGTLNIRTTFPNPQGVIRPGQFVRAKIKGAVWVDALVVPQRAVQQGNKEMFVYLVSDGKAVMQPITPGEWFDDYWIVKSGLKAGDVVITDGVNKVQSGMPVKITKTSTL